MARFYENWRVKSRPPAEALRDAQRWLRDTTNAEKAALFNPRRPTGELTMETARPLWRALIRRPPQERSFAHLADWGAFSYIGR